MRHPEDQVNRREHRCRFGGGRPALPIPPDSTRSLCVGRLQEKLKEISEPASLADETSEIREDVLGGLFGGGPGQVIAYPLLDLRRHGYFVKELVYRLEEAIIRTLRHFGVTGHRVTGAPGIYVRLDDPFGHRTLNASAAPQTATTPEAHFQGLGKIAALGIKVSRHCSYHGVALNVAMDLTPFDRINPCGYAGLRTVDLALLGVSADWGDAAAVLPRVDARNHPPEHLQVVETGEAGVLQQDRVIGGRALDRMHLAGEVVGEGQREGTDVGPDIHDPLTA